MRAWGFSPSEHPEDLGEDRPATLRSARPLLVPAGDEEALAGGEPPDLLPLGEKGDTLPDEAWRPGGMRGSDL